MFSVVENSKLPEIHIMDSVRNLRFLRIPKNKIKDNWEYLNNQYFRQGTMRFENV